MLCVQFNQRETGYPHIQRKTGQPLKKMKLISIASLLLWLRRWSTLNTTRATVASNGCPIATISAETLTAIEYPWKNAAGLASITPHAIISPT
uniref:Uncharacterized protein n=1 Tax=Daphnia galeata TaxID=27404 RepID=A0A8J2WDW7_9CRUS|nr:unnamed protein product [Daphnia galeata]